MEKISVVYSRCFIVKEAEKNMELRGRVSKVGVCLNVVGMRSSVHVKNESRVKI